MPGVRLIASWDVLRDNRFVFIKQTAPLEAPNNAIIKFRRIYLANVWIVREPETSLNGAHIKRSTFRGKFRNPQFFDS